MASRSGGEAAVLREGSLAEAAANPGNGICGDPAEAGGLSGSLCAPERVEGALTHPPPSLLRPR